MTNHARAIDSAIVGLGRWGRGHVKSMQAAGEARALRFVRAIDPALEANRAFADEHGLRLSADLDDALDDAAIRAIVLATPHSLHRAQVEACARAGKAVFCEKPLALTLIDARAMIDACNRAGVVLGVGHLRRFWPSMRALRQVVESGELGEVLHIEGHFSNEHSNNVVGGWRESPAESPGAGLTGAGLHIVDAFTCLIGPAQRVVAQIVERKPPPAPLDSVCALYRLDAGEGRQVSGVLASVRASPMYWRVHVFGARGSIEALGEHEIVRHASGRAPAHETLAPNDAMRAQLD
ncbi:MAG: Gfo/Idh/MocA family oxidoreductase, partial [Proteobacteria bacterium]|nr:Gfo/Idh/MocA family oxidoreductase [Burkholderiales bacterium]